MNNLFVLNSILGEGASQKAENTINYIKLQEGESRERKKRDLTHLDFPYLVSLLKNFHVTGGAKLN